MYATFRKTFIKYALIPTRNFFLVLKTISYEVSLVIILLTFLVLILSLDIKVFFLFQDYTK